MLALYIYILHGRRRTGKRERERETEKWWIIKIQSHQLNSIQNSQWKNEWFHIFGLCIRVLWHLAVGTFVGRSGPAGGLIRTSEDSIYTSLGYDYDRSILSSMMSIASHGIPSGHRLYSILNSVELGIGPLASVIIPTSETAAIGQLAKLRKRESVEPSMIWRHFSRKSSATRNKRHTNNVGESNIGTRL